MKVIGIDIGRANTGTVIYDTIEKEVTAFTTIELPIAKVKRHAKFNATSYRLALLHDSLIRFIERNIDTSCGEPALAVIEDYAYGNAKISLEEFRKMDKMTLEVGEVNGVVYMTIYQLGIPMIKISPTQLKYFVTGDGSCDKIDVIRSMHKRYRYPLEDDHQYDALALCHIGRYYCVFCKNPASIPEGSYEYNVMINLAFDMKYASVSKMLGLNL